LTGASIEQKGLSIASRLDSAKGSEPKDEEGDEASNRAP
jgi:hypothetical protein